MKSYPTDLAITSVVAALAYLVVTTLPEGSHLRLAAALPLVLIVPGYALIAALFPASPRPARENARSPEEKRPGGIDAAERWGLSFALSLAILPMIVIALALTEWHLTTASTAAALALVSIGLAQVGAVRRLRIPEAERFSVAPRAAVGRLRRGGTVATASSILLALGVAAAVVALTFALVVPQATGGFSELGLYTEDDEGDLVADFPDEIDPGESVPVVVEVANEEGEEMTYEVVLQEQLLEDGTVVERNELDVVSTQVEDGQHAEAARNVTPATEDGPVRIAALLYEGDDRPSTPTIENADEDAYGWVNVTPEGAEDGFESVDDLDDGTDSESAGAGGEGDTDGDEGDGADAGTGADGDADADDDDGDGADDDDDETSLIEAIFGDDDDDDDG